MRLSNLAPAPTVVSTTSSVEIFLLRMDVDGDAAAVVADADRAVDVDLDVDVLAKPGQGLIDAVVDQFVDEMMQALAAGIADVHAGALANVGGVAQHLHIFVGVVVGTGLFGLELLFRGQVHFIAHLLFLLIFPRCED